ncbi:uncharacterized protein [Palaemon carinicauda]|uniref:uncharacterized protein n=1 Tax=Palaemon carinicauda TaxID=392227 RepID=UPI0035B5B646
MYSISPRSSEYLRYLSIRNTSSLQEADSGIYKQTWDLFDHKDRSQSFVNSPATGINRVLEKKFVYIGPTTYTESLATRLGRRKFHFGRSSFYPQGIVIGFFPGTPYKDIFNDLLLRMVEGGLVTKWRDDEIMAASSQLNLVEETKTKAITLTHLQAAFFVIALGSSLATVVLLMENAVVCTSCMKQTSSIMKIVMSFACLGRSGEKQPPSSGNLRIKKTPAVTDTCQSFRTSGTILFTSVQFDVKNTDISSDFDGFVDA